MNSVRSILPGPLAHFLAYAALTAVAIAGYGSSLGASRIIAAPCVYAAALEHIRHFSRGRHGRIVSGSLDAVDCESYPPAAGVR